MSQKGRLNPVLLGVAILASPAFAQDAPSVTDSNQPVTDDEVREISAQPATDTLDVADVDTGPRQAEPTLDQVVEVAEDAPAEPIEEVTDEELLQQAFLRYRELMDDGIFDEADNAAKRVVELAIRVSGPNSTETARALTNLGIVQHSNGQYDAAQQNFQSAIDIIEEREDRLNKMLINPLRGIGAAQLEGGRPDLATETFARAVHITHVNEGPHNMEQIELLETLAETQLRMGMTQEAKEVHDSIHALNVRHFRQNPIDMIPSLMRRASWQHRTGYIIDERATYRRIIRIIEREAGKLDTRLIDPLTRLGRSYFFLDRSGADPLNQPSLSAGEIHFKRALRIARESEQSNWETESDALVALGDFYLMQGSILRARSQYNDAWELMSAEPERLDRRANTLGRIKPLRRNVLPTYAGQATRSDRLNPDEILAEGQVTVSYRVSERGRVTGFKIAEANPAEFLEIQRQVQREVRSRVFRPMFVEGEPVTTDNLTYTHTFFYRKSELDALRETKAAGGTEVIEET
ncbi:MAG: tetratricopeptide repeat protein [Woeseiaceae bacterium]|nr:tetratricopeptide repeat protein [Woeseiaceae bacterium]